MNALTYLIKEAVNVAQLAQVAKKNNIPLVGDWRYAAKLLHKAEGATPAGAAHYNNVVGFTTPAERTTLSGLRTQAQTAEGRAANWSTLNNPNLVAALTDAEREVPSDVMKNSREFGIMQRAGQKPLPLIGTSNSTPRPFSNKEFGKSLSEGKLPVIQFKRTLHTHPDITINPSFAEELAQTPHRVGPLGYVSPSGPLDTPGGALSPEVLKGLSTATSMPEVNELLKKPRTIPAPKTLEEAIDTYKRNPFERHRADLSDLSTIAAPTRSTNRILSPETGNESVFKGNNGLLRRMYFRQGQPLA